MDKLEKFPDSKDAENREKEYIQERNRIMQEQQAMVSELYREIHTILENDNIYQHATIEEMREKIKMFNKVLAYIREIKSKSKF